MKEFVKDYFVNAARELGETISDYLNNSKYNYVILDGEDVVVWRKENTPCIFGSMDEVAQELTNWATPIKNISILTEQDLLTKYCQKEMDIAIIAEKKAELAKMYPMNTSNGHAEELVDLINKLWNKNMSKFEPILVALYKRDINEIYNADSFADLPNNKDSALALLIVNWENHAENYLMHIADDGDLETIINFIRDPEFNLIEY